MSAQTAAAILWGHATGLVINYLFIHSVTGAVVVTMLAGLLLCAAALYDEWRHPATSYTLGRR